MNLLNKNFLSRLKKLAKKNKIGICSYCNESKTIFQTVPQKGDQCEDCYREQKKVKKSKRAIQKRKSVKDYTAEADKVTSELVRKLNMSHSGHVECYTCKNVMPYNEAQCGHFISRKELGTRWLLENCRPQCHTCNVDKRGNLELFKERLERDSPGITEKLEIISKHVNHFEPDELKNLIREYKERIKALK